MTTRSFGMAYSPGMRPVIATVILSLAVAVPGCGRREADPPPPPAPAVPAPGQPPAAPQPAVPADAPCIAGDWVANDLVEAVRAAIRADLRDATLTRASGTLAMTVGVPDAQRHGEIVIHANDLVHSVTARRRVRVTASHALSGEATIPFDLEGDDVIVLGETSDGQITTRVSVTAGGVDWGRSQNEPTDLRGSYVYECRDDTLRVWKRRPNGQRGGAAVVFDRAPPTAG